MSEPDTDSFASLLHPDLSANPDAFLTVYRDGILRSPNCLDALTRFGVTYIHVNKISKAMSQHELLSTHVIDNTDKLPYTFYVERNRRTIDAPPRLKPDAAMTSASALVSTSLESVLSTNVTQVKGQTPMQQSSETYPLISLDNPPTPSESVSHVLLTRISTSKKRTFVKKMTLASIESAHSSAGSLTAIAEDLILGRGKFVREDSRTGRAEAIREIGQIIHQVEPKEHLSFYELGILIDVVHNEAPEYTLLQNQCYWFATTICEIIILLYSNKLAEANTDKPGAKCSPDNYLPNLAGRWNNILIVALKNDLLKKIAIKFMERREEEISKIRRAHREGLGHTEEIQGLHDNAAFMQAQVQHLLKRIEQLEGTGTDMMAGISVIFVG